MLQVFWIEYSRRRSWWIFWIGICYCRFSNFICGKRQQKTTPICIYIYIVNGMCGVFFFCFFGWTLSVLPHNNFKCTTFLGDRYSMNFPIKHEFNAHEQTKYELYICLFIQLLNWFTAIGIFDVRSFPYNNYMNAHTTREIYRSLFIYY